VLIQAVIEPPAEAREQLAAALTRYLPHADVTWFSSADWRVRLATFGYLAFGDMVKLEDTLSDHVAKQEGLTLRMRRIVPLPEEKDDSVWVGLEGDVEELELLAQEFPSWVHGLGYLLDRYSFRPRIRLARINSRTTVDYLEQLIADVGDYSGPAWTASVVQIVRRKPDGTQGALYKTHAELPMAEALAAVPVGGALTTDRQATTPAGFPAQRGPGRPRQEG
jgi:2'-5' RNA ligase